MFNKITGTDNNNYLIGAAAFSNQVSVFNSHEEIVGSDIDDVIRGSADDDRISGNDGNDIIKGKEGNDIVFGDEGADRISGGLGEDELHGGSDNDFISGNEGNDLITGGAGNDRLHGDEGVDVIRAGDGHDKIKGGTGNDVIDAGEGSDYVRGGAGSDKIYGGIGHDVIKGGIGDDYIDAGGWNDKVWGGAGSDEIYGGSGNDEIHGGGNQSTNLKMLDGVFSVKDFDQFKIDIDIISSNAGYNNSIGVYFSDKDGNPVSGEILFNNVKNNIGDTDEITLDVPAGAESAGLFIIPNGDRKNADLESGTEIIRFELIADPVGGEHDFWAPVYLDKDGREVVVIGQTSGGDAAPALFSDKRLNEDIEFLKQDGTNFGWEDIFSGGDRDFNDVIHSIQAKGRALDKADFISGGAGNDKIWGELGDDVIEGNSGDDKIWGGVGHDHIEAGSGVDEVWGGDGNDVIYTNKGEDTAWGGEGDDILFGGSPNMIKNGSFEDGYNADELKRGWTVFKDGIEGWEVTSGKGLEVQVNGIVAESYHGIAHAELDSHNNSSIRQFLATEAGQDYVISFKYMPRPNVPEDSNVIEVLWNDEVVMTLTGEDKDWKVHSLTVIANSSSSSISFRAAGENDSYGGFIDDIKVVAGEDDYLSGGDGDDMAFGGAGDDLLTGGNGNDKLDGSWGADKLRGDNGNDVLRGEDGEDLLRGGSGQDILDGGVDNDVLRGDSGNDILIGGKGHDILTGGSGSDVFYFSAADLNSCSEDGFVQTDIIRDLNVKEDDIVVEDVFEGSLKDLLVSGDVSISSRDVDGDNKHDLVIAWNVLKGDNEFTQEIALAKRGAWVKNGEIKDKYLDQLDIVFDFTADWGGDLSDLEFQPFA